MTPTTTAVVRPTASATAAYEFPATKPSTTKPTPQTRPPECVEGQEAAVGHARNAGQQGHRGSRERNKAAEEHRRATATCQKISGSVDTGATPGDGRPVQQPRTEMPADLVSDAVTDDRRYDDDRRHDLEVDVAPARGDATDHRSGLPRDQEPDEHRVLAEDQKSDTEVHPEGRHVQQTLHQVIHTRYRSTQRRGPARARPNTIGQDLDRSSMRDHFLTDDPRRRCPRRDGPLRAGRTGHVIVPRSLVHVVDACGPEYGDALGTCSPCGEKHLPHDPDGDGLR